MNKVSRDWFKINQDYLLAEIRVIKEKLNAYRNSLDENQISASSNPDLKNAEKELEKIKKEIAGSTRMEVVEKLFQLSPFEKNILLMGLSIELDNSVGRLIADIQFDENIQLPTFSLALSIFKDAHWSALTPDAPLRYWNLIEVNRNQVLTRSRFSINEMILHYLTGINTLDYRIASLVKPVLTSHELVPSHRRIADNISVHLSGSSPEIPAPIIQLEGNSLQDQKEIVAQVFARFNMAIYSLSTQLLPSSFQELSELLNICNREALLFRYALFLDGNDLGIHEKERNEKVKYLLENFRSPVVFSSRLKFSNLDRRVQNIEVRKPLREEQQILWKENLGIMGEELETEINTLVGQFNLDNSSIISLAQDALKNSNGNGSSTMDNSRLKVNLWSSCCHHTRPDLSSLAQRIEPFAKWNDLILPEKQKAILGDICIHLEKSRKVYDEWGFRQKSSRGLGITALFSGESGTGKTMASEVLANALQLDLYRIDLSQVVNKYIGETEKNLKKIFDAAEDSGAILLFDEADALFGKRSEVKDSHDRYSNIEVSFLLQKMEEYRGLAILTTNLKNAIDKAFLRRIRFIIHFPFPDLISRKEIWKSVFPKKTPTQNLNFDKLGKLNVAGGNIRNIALNACFAAAHKDQAVTMIDIHNAAQNEYLKLEKHMSPSEVVI